MSASETKTNVIASIYRNLIKPFFFAQDPEQVHDRMTHVGAFLGKYTLGRKTTRAMLSYENTKLEQDILGIHFKNPVGLSAGFDKNAELTDILPSVGFGFEEVGSITGEVCVGNPKPRLWRLPKSKSLAVYYGLKNDGCEVIAKRLKQKEFTFPVGVSVAMTNIPENADIEKGIEDFAKAFETMKNVAAYITVNISCPNTCSGQPFVESENFERLFDRLDRISTEKPVFIKLSPDIGFGKIDALLEIANRHRVDGVICTNLTKKRDNPRILDSEVPTYGGLSGKVVSDLADEMLVHIYKHYNHRFVLVGSGGVFSAQDAYRKIRLGASLIQLITGMVFEGPQLIGAINRGLVKLLERDGFTTIADVVGVDVPEAAAK